MEGKTHYEQIIGGTQEGKKMAQEELQSAFEKQDKKLAEHEIEKTPEDLEIIKKTESIVDKIVSQYGGEPKALPLNNIYILRPGSVLAVTDGDLAGGLHRPFGLKIGVEKNESKLLFASGIAHELFHLKSYKSARIGKSGQDANPYRIGLSMIDGKNPDKKAGEEKEYLAEMEEAIVAECVKKFLDEISKDNIFSEEATAVDQFRDWVGAFNRSHRVSEEKSKEFEEELKYIANPQRRVRQVMANSDDQKARQSFAAGMLKGLHEKGEVEFMERRRERKKLYELLDNLVVNSDRKFKNRDEIFDEFARANFSGNLLPLARIVEGIMGKGSFRKLAEEFSREPKKKKEEDNLIDLKL